MMCDFVLTRFGPIALDSVRISHHPRPVHHQAKPSAEIANSLYKKISIELHKHTGLRFVRLMIVWSSAIVLDVISTLSWHVVK